MVPVVKLNPVVGPRESRPWGTDSESGSELIPAAASITEVAMLVPLEKASETFSVSGAVLGAAIAGAARALVVSDAPGELESASPA